MAIFKPNYVKKILIKPCKTKKGIKKATQWLNEKFKDNNKEVVFVCVLKGASPFFINLIMQIKFDVTTEFVTMSSFRGKTKAEGDPELLTDFINEIKGKDVVVVEDVCDSAKTLSKLINHIKGKKPHSVTTVVLVDKPDTRKVKFNPDYSCFKIYNNPFLIGYGLDIKEIARNLPYIAEFDKDYLNKI